MLQLRDIMGDMRREDSEVKIVLADRLTRAAMVSTATTQSLKDSDLNS